MHELQFDKGRYPDQVTDYFWPDADNTLRAFEYVRGGLIKPNPRLPEMMASKAVATLALCGLDRYPSNGGLEPTSADSRWLRRQQAWLKAEHYRDILLRQDTVEIRELIVDNAVSRGEFSIWWTVFAGDVDMRRRLRLAFTGTHEASFDSNEDLVPRRGGQL